MNDRTPAELRARAADVEVREVLHAVPPHDVFEVEVDGRRAVCKVSVDERGAAGVEGRTLRRVDRETSVPVPEILDVGSNWFLAAYRGDAPEEPPDDDRVLETAWLRAAGRTLATLHEDARFDRPGLLAIDGDPSDPASGLRVDAPSGATWPDALDDLLAIYERSVAGTGYADAIVEVRDFLSAHAERFAALEGTTASLLHGWFTPDHVAVAGGEATCVIDFEHALAGNPEWDYWRTAIALFRAGGWDGPDDAESTFRDAYESVRPLPTGFDERADAYRAFVAASHLDSLATQRGIDDETREVAAFLSTHVTEAVDNCRESWADG
ncbi:phosphotransferase family protein [Halovivax limisalsi]|uniref:phosphotransferase family protein n=1 Tax=Halovivax limisalsi TaxID=1453760 RepID=UPI001FFCED52|nr:aminoglycoside phosphotransferase family protein [Halovivax limisalsi]